MSKKPDGMKSKAKPREKRVYVKGPAPAEGYGPRKERIANQVAVQSRKSAIDAEGTLEAKTALANGVVGSYFYMGDFFQIVEEKKHADAPLLKLVKDEGGNFITYAQLMMGQARWDEKLAEMKFSEVKKSGMNSIHTKLHEYAGEQIMAVKAAYIKEKIATEKKQAREAELAKAKAAVITSASDKLPAMFYRRQPGAYKFSDGVVVDVKNDWIEVLVGNDQFTSSHNGENSFFLHMTDFQRGVVLRDERIQDEKLWDSLRTWRTAVLNYLLAAKEKTPRPVVASAALEDMFFKNVPGTYRLNGGLVVKFENNMKGPRYRVIVGNDEIAAVEKNFMPSYMLDIEVINPNGKIVDEEFRASLHAWQVALQSVLKTERAKLTPPATTTAEEPLVVHIGVTEPLAEVEGSAPEAKQVYVPKCLTLPSLKEAKCLTAEVLQSMTPQTSGLFYIRGGKGRAYLLASGGKLWLTKCSDAFPEDHILSRVHEIHFNSEMDERKLVYVDIHAISQKQNLDEIVDVTKMKDARRAVQRFLARLLLEAKGENTSEQVTATMSQVTHDRTANTPFAEALGSMFLVAGENQAIH